MGRPPSYSFSITYAPGFFNNKILKSAQSLALRFSLWYNDLCRSFSAKARNWDVLDRATGKHYKFVESTHLQNVEVFAGGRSKTPYKKAYVYFSSTLRIGIICLKEEGRNDWNTGKQKLKSSKNQYREELANLKDEEKTHMSEKSMEKERITHIVFRLLQNANKVLDKKQKEKSSEYVDGLSDAYYEVLCTIQSELLFAEQDLSEFGLDIDLEKTFL